MSSEQDAVLEWVPVDRLVAHPENPRLVLRAQVVTDIAGALTRDGFRVEHAILAVPAADGDGLVIVSGHHRVAAAREAGLETVPAWVRAMTADERFMALLLSNRQGELSPLEVGTHALRYVQRASGGRGQKGGLSEYADRIGRSKGHMSELRDAAEVAQTVRLSERFSADALLDKAKHLYEVSQAPAEAWAPLVGALISEKWRVSDAKNRVRTAGEVVDAIPARHRSWLDPAVTVGRWLETGEPTPRAVVALVAEVERCEEMVCEHTPGEVEAFRAWLSERGVELGRLEVMDAEEEAGDDEAEEVRARQEEERARATGTDLDLRVCACRDLTVGEPVDAIVCDPPYPEEHLDCYTELASFAARALRPGGSLLAMCGQSYLPDVLARLTATEGLTYQWTLAYLTPGGQAVQLWQRKVNTFFKPVIWMVKGAYDGPWMSDVARSEVNDNDKRYHHWGQSESGMADLISRVTGPGDLVCDPFLGGGTTGRVALALDRRFVGGDIDPDVVAVTRRRITEARDADPTAAPEAAA